MTIPAILLANALWAFAWGAHRLRGISPAKRAGSTPGVFSLVVLWGALFSIASPVWGKDFETVTFEAPHLGGKDAPLNVILPEGYDGSVRRYPVLYLLHGSLLGLGASQWHQALRAPISGNHRHAGGRG